MRTLWLRMILAAGILVLADGPAGAGVAGSGCCRCTGCADPELFACRAALNMSDCDAACADLGCADKQFMPETDCIGVSQCFGDCCDDPNAGCNQVPEGSCSGGNLFFANSFCDASNCLAQPPTATVTATGTASPTPTLTATATASASVTVTATGTDTPTPIPSATPSATAVDTPSPTETSTVTPTDTAVDSPTSTATHTGTPTGTASATETPTAQPPTATLTAAPTASATPSHTATAPATESVTPTRTPPLVDTPSPTPTPTEVVTDDLTWLIDGTDRIRTLTGIPVAGVTYRNAQLPSLSLLDAADRFCGLSGLLPQIRLDLPAESCQNQCMLGIFPDVAAGEARIAHLPALNGVAGTFDVLIDTPQVCVPGQPLVTLRMHNAVTYTSCVGDCDSDGDTEVNEVLRGVAVALGEASLGSCPANDRSGDGTVTIDELLVAVRNLLDGCPATP